MLFGHTNCLSDPSMITLYLPENNTFIEHRFLSAEVFYQRENTITFSTSIPVQERYVASSINGLKVVPHGFLSQL
jgi:hypothetical protein